jgi:hypothetical protein
MKVFIQVMQQKPVREKNNMKKQGSYPQEELEHLGNGDLDKGIEEIKKQGWKVVSITEDHNSDQKFYHVEKA